MSHVWLPVHERGVEGKRCMRCRSVVANSPSSAMQPTFARAGFSVTFIPPNTDGSLPSNLQCDIVVPSCRRV